MNVEKKYISELILAGGRILCKRCTAKSKRTGVQCQKPALKSSSTQKCSFHGGLSRGPVTPEGKARSAKANLKTGDFTVTTKKRESTDRALVRVLEDASHLLGMVAPDTPRMRGRKPATYPSVSDEADIHPAIAVLRNIL